LFLWNMNRIRAMFYGDIDCALILGEIAHHNRQIQFARNHAERVEADGRRRARSAAGRQRPSGQARAGVTRSAPPSSAW